MLGLRDIWKSIPVTLRSFHLIFLVSCSRVENIYFIFYMLIMTNRYYILKEFITEV